MKTNNPIETKIPCPECGTVIDIDNIKKAFKYKLDQEMDRILDEL